jgi:hypothetical protein
MLCHNVRKSLGDAAARHAHTLANEARAHNNSRQQLYGDGRLAPCEFVRGADGWLYKSDCDGHDTDHTIVGKQPIWWDLAGIIVEWRLRNRHHAEFLGALQAAGVTDDANVLRFYCACYAAFRLGMATMCELTASKDEQRRLNGAAEFYREQLAGFVGSSVQIRTLNPLAV